MSHAALLRRQYVVVRTACLLWCLYKVPSLWRRMLRRPELENLDATHARAARIVLDCALDLRGVIIKLCQVVATRADIFPPALVGPLKQCHDAVPPKPFAVVRDVVERELGRSLSEVFAEFEEQPIASASLAQVHAARLCDGREVAVKVQYPDIEEIVRTDLVNMRRVCRVYEFFDPQPLELLPLLTELTTHLSYELDFEREARSADRVRELFAHDDHVVVPEMLHELSTRQLLVMQRVGGIKITETDQIEAQQCMILCLK